MASLKFIMDVDVDHTDASTHGNIRDPGSFATPSGSRASDSLAHQNYAPTPGQGVNVSNNDTNINQMNLGRPEKPTIPATTTTAIDPSISAADAPPSLRKSHAGSLEGAPRSPGVPSSSSRPVYPRRRSTTSTDSMDRHGYASPTFPGATGSGGAGAGRGGFGRQGGIGGNGGGVNPNQLNRPMGPHTPTEPPVRLTPITGRISRAKKGQPVHPCEICRPPKTFTRAEHLRRHQLSHQTPGFPCTYPGCDRAFHRQDLLVRHQQKHDQEGDAASSRGGDHHRRGSSASTLGGTSGMSLQPPGPLSIASGSASGSGMGTSTPASSCDVPSTPNIPHGMLRSVGSSPGDMGGPQVSPHGMGERRTSYDFTVSRQSRDFSNTSYVLSPSASDNPVLQYPTVSTSLESPSLTTPTEYNHLGYDHQQPRSQPLFVVTAGLSGQPHPPLHIPDGGIPELIPTTDVSLSSPWASSTDSTYSTPSDSRSHRPADWIRGQESPHNGWLTPYSGPGPREPLQIEAMAPQYLINQYPASPHPLVSPHTVFSAHPGNPSHPYGILDVPMAAFSAAGDPSQGIHQVMANDPGSAAIGHGSAGPRNSISLSSIGSQSPAMASARPADSLVAPRTILPADRVGMMVGMGCQKEVMVADASGMSIAVSMGGATPLLGPVSYGMGGGNDNSPGGGNFMPGQGLGGMGGCVSGSILVSNPLAKTVRNAIPNYLEAYWRRLHAVYPLVHRRMAEGAGDDVLRYAMAAMGTLFLDGKEDRNRGGILHDHAVQELKSVTQWNLSTMQAVIMCEYFARFRGKKAVTTKSSQQFESLYSRAIHQLPSLFSHAPTAQNYPNLTTDQRWRFWLNLESHRRLLSACFFLDVHASIYHQHSRTRDFNLSGAGNVPPIPLIRHSRALWNAQSAEEWDAILTAEPANGRPDFIPDPNTLEPMIPEEGSASGYRGNPLNLFDRLAILASEASRLPKRSVPGFSPTGSDGGSPTPVADNSRHADGGWSVMGGPSPGIELDPALGANATSTLEDPEDRISRLFPGCPVANTYLAIHHTPLHDLLAVSGDSSMSSHKSTSSKASIVENQKRIRLWVEEGRASPTSASPGCLNKSVVRATMYAARALTEFLGAGCHVDAGGESSGVTVCRISDYWAIYVCGLICWSYVHRAARENGQGRPSGSSALNGTGGGESSGPSALYGEALQWLRSAARTRPDDAEAWAGLRASMAARGIIGLVRRRIEPDLTGGKSQLYSDAVSVLKKIEEGATWRWF